jgi:hypothetical protein
MPSFEQVSIEQWEDKGGAEPERLPTKFSRSRAMNSAGPD